MIDLKFNRINDLLELSNLKGLILEIDLRGNGCTKWPNYKSVILFSIPSIHTIDGNHVSTSEKVHNQELSHNANILKIMYFNRLLLQFYLYHQWN